MPVQILNRCLTKLGKYFSAAERSLLTRMAEKYTADGMSEEDASISAVNEILEIHQTNLTSANEAMDLFRNVAEVIADDHPDVKSRRALARFISEEVPEAKPYSEVLFTALSSVAEGVDRSDWDWDRLDETSSIIPTDAEKVSSSSATISSGNETDHNEKEAALAGHDLMPTSLALVAPDCTPDATKPLDPSMVPAPAKPVPPLSTVQAHQDSRASSVMGLFTSGSRASQDADVLSPGMSGESLMRNGMPPPGKSGSTAVKSAMGRFNFNG